MLYYANWPLITNFILLFLLLSANSYAQLKANECNSITEGIFYAYPKNSDAQYMYIRNGGIQTERNLLTGDSSVWKIKWQSGCVYTMQYVSGSAKVEALEKEFLQEHKLAVKVETVTSGYYVYKSYADKVSGNFLSADTMWLQPKLNVANNKLFEEVPLSILKKLKFSDTSACALLYVYRPGRFAGSGGEYILYFDDNAMCVSKNNAAYVFKILKEGSFKIYAKLFNQRTVEEKIDIKFGKKYFLKAGVKFIATTASGWRADLALKDEEKGYEEFLEAQ